MSWTECRAPRVVPLFLALSACAHTSTAAVDNTSERTDTDPSSAPTPQDGFAKVDTQPADAMFVREICEHLCFEDEACHCDLNRKVGQWILLRVVEGPPTATIISWYAAARGDETWSNPIHGYRLLAPISADVCGYHTRDDDDDEDDSSRCAENPDYQAASICNVDYRPPFVFRNGDRPPSGLITATTADLTANGAGDLVIECHMRRGGGSPPVEHTGRYLRVCNNKSGWCSDELWLLQTKNDRILYEGDVEFFETHVEMIPRIPRSGPPKHRAMP
jgi:hypothetical protein